MEAESIFHSHLDTNAPMPVNIDSSAVKDAEEHLQNPNNDMFRLQQQQVKWVNLFVLIEVESIGSNQRYLVHLLFKWELDAFCPALQDLVCEISLNEGNWDTIWTSFETFNGCSKMQYGLKNICLILCSPAVHCKTLEISSHRTCTVFCRFIRWWNLTVTHVFWSLMCTDRALWLRLKEDFSIMKKERKRGKTKPGASSGRYLFWNTMSVFLGNDPSLQSICNLRYSDNSPPGQFTPDNSPLIFKQLAPHSFIHYWAKWAIKYMNPRLNVIQIILRSFIHTRVWRSGVSGLGWIV